MKITAIVTDENGVEFDRAEAEIAADTWAKITKMLPKTKKTREEIAAEMKGRTQKENILNAAASVIGRLREGRPIEDNVARSMMIVLGDLVDLTQLEISGGRGKGH